MFPKLLQRLFANEGAGPKLRTDILPLDNKTLGVNGEGAVAVQLSDAVDSASSTTAASSNAVKTVWDKANSAAASANAAKTTATSAQTKANSAYTLAEGASFPTGTKLLFHQAAAPTGWTKQTTVNDATLRVVSGTTGGGTGGSIAFSTLFASGKAVTLSGNVGATTLTTAQMPKHSHTIQLAIPGTGGSGEIRTAQQIYGPAALTTTTEVAGGSTSHTHTLSGSAKIALNVKYTDVIICAKA